MSNIIKEASISKKLYIIGSDENGEIEGLKISTDDTGPFYSTGNNGTEIQNLEKEYNELQNKVKKAKRDLKEIKSRSDKILSETREEAEKIKEKARKKGYEAGHSEGFENGTEKARSEFASLIKEGQLIVEEAKIQKKLLLRENEKEIVMLALKIAEKLTKRKFDKDPSLIRDTVKKALKRIKYPEQINIRIPEKTSSYLNGSSEEIFQSIDKNKVTLEEDSELNPGSCIIENHMGTVDARIETQFKEIESGFSRLFSGSEQNGG